MISVIVPVFKVEEYLDQCVKSIVGQSYSDLEIILVDDGSPDKCPQMCDEWADKDSRIKVIHKQNGGLSDARNAGLEIATGDYVAFVDSDDWLAEDFYEVLIRAATENDAQIVASGVVKIDEETQCFSGNNYEERVYSSEEAIQTIMQAEGFHAVAWNKIYQKELFEGITYPVNKLHEDEFVTYRLLDRAERLVICQKTVYYYRQRGGSIMSTWSKGHLDALEAAVERLALLKQKYPSLYPQDYAIFCIACVEYYRGLLASRKYSELLLKIKKYRKMTKISFKQWQQLNLKQKIYVTGAGVNIDLLARALNLRGGQIQGVASTIE